MLNIIKKIFIGILTIPLIRRIFKKNQFYIFTNFPHNSDGLATRHNFDFIKEKDFLSAYEAITPPLMVCSGGYIYLVGPLNMLVELMEILSNAEVTRVVPPHL